MYIIGFLIKKKIFNNKRFIINFCQNFLTALNKIKFNLKGFFKLNNKKSIMYFLIFLLNVFII